WRRRIVTRDENSRSRQNFIRDAANLRRHLGPEFFRGPSDAGRGLRRMEAGLWRAADRSAHPLTNRADRADVDAGKSPVDLRLSYRRFVRLQLFARRGCAISRQHFPAAGPFLDRAAKASR